MEEKCISEKESIEIISRMISSTKTRLGRGAGNEFLIWGYSCLIASAAVLVIAFGFRLPHAGYAYFLIPILGFSAKAVMRLKGRNKQADSGQATTYIDKCVKTLFSCGTGTLAGYCVIGIWHYDTHEVWIGMFFLGLFVPSFCTTVMGELLQMKKVKEYAFAGLIISCLFLAHIFIEDELEWMSVIIGAVSWTLSLIVPGHILNKEAKKKVENLKLNERA